MKHEKSRKIRKQNKRCSVEEKNEVEKNADRANLIAMICCIEQKINERA